MSLFSELRRRKVVRIALIYAVAAWGVLQAADVLGALAGLPDWALRVVLLALVLGFPVTLLLAWMFKITTLGIERDDVAPALRPRVAHRVSGSVAVVPFRNPDVDADQYLADGLTEEVLSALSALGAKRIPPRISCCRIEDLQEIASKLSVSYVVGGTLRRIAGGLQTDVELIDVTTGVCIWSDTYAVPSGSLARLADDIARAMTNALGADVSEGREKARRHERSPEAYTAFLKGRHSLNRATAAGCHEAVEYFDEALAADPTFARAHAGVASAYWWLASYGGLLPEQGFPRARAAAQRALALDDELAEAHLGLGQVQLGYEWDFPSAEKSFRRALALEPVNAEAHRLYGHFLQMMGKCEQALQMRREAVRLDPLSLHAHRDVADSAFTAGSFDEALRVLDRIIELDPSYPTSHLRARIELRRGRPREALSVIRQDPMAWRRHYISAIAHHCAGESKLAQQELRELIQSHGGEGALQIAVVYSQLGDKDQAFRWLEQACAQRDPGLIELRADPELEHLRSDDRFRSLEQRVGFREFESATSVTCISRQKARVMRSC